MRIILHHSFNVSRARRSTSTVLIWKSLQKRRWSSTTTTRTGDPLRILFCGSDDFSCHSLKALDIERKQNPSLVASIDVVTRPGKKTGRGGKIFREVPIKKLAVELDLPTHERDTFTGWTPPSEFNLIIAVSFGLFVPPRLLGAAKYGGLNVHPSLLPDLAGASPIQHAILLQRPTTGITLQTLDAHAFDAGTILSQYPSTLPGIPIPSDATTRSLTTLLSPMGAELLVSSLRQGLHLPGAPRPTIPISDSSIPAGEQPTRAPKLTKADAQVPWANPRDAMGRTRAKNATASAIAARARALGPLWTLVPGKESWRMSPPSAGLVTGSPEPEKPTRILLEDVSAVPMPREHSLTRTWWVCNFYTKGWAGPVAMKCRVDDGGGLLWHVPGREYLRVGRMKVEGTKDYRPAADVLPQIAKPGSFNSQKIHE